MNDTDPIQDFTEWYAQINRPPACVGFSPAEWELYRAWMCEGVTTSKQE